MTRSVTLLALVLFGSACGAVRSGGRPPTEGEYLRSRELMVPVHGVSRRQLRDTYSAPRSGGRAHLALDVMAKKGTRVLAVDDGVVLRIGENELGGRIIYLSDPERRFVYYYAHLDKWAYGLKEGQRVSRGQLIGSVGTTGNAPKDAPHLHFQLLRMGSGRQWWSGEPLNPIPYLRKKGRERFISAERVR
jgi:murein DD-endopeptidase MepM/ murein hydrolase activator NlpD